MNKKVRNKLLFEDIMFYITTPIRYIYNKLIKLYLTIKHKNTIETNNNKIYYKKDKNIKIYNNYEKLFKELTNTEYTYHYQINDKINKTTTVNNILKEVFKYPQTFKIPEEYKNEYSKQQIELINQTKIKLKELGYNDIYNKNKINYEECIKRNKKNYYYLDEYQNNKKEFEKIENIIKIIIKITTLLLIITILLITIKPNNNKNLYKIIDETKTCKQQKETFYKDDQYEYYFNCIKSANIKIIYENKKYNLKEALNEHIIKIDDLKKYIKFQKKPLKKRF